MFSFTNTMKAIDKNNMKALLGLIGGDFGGNVLWVSAICFELAPVRFPAYPHSPLLVLIVVGAPDPLVPQLLLYFTRIVHFNFCFHQPNYLYYLHQESLALPWLWPGYSCLVHSKLWLSLIKGIFRDHVPFMTVRSHSISTLYLFYTQTCCFLLCVVRVILWRPI